MSRKARQCKVDAIAGKPIEERIRWAQYGDDANPAAEEIVRVLHGAAFIESIQDRISDKARESVPVWRDGAWRMISRLILRACEQRDGSTFRAIATVIDGRSKDPVRELVYTWIGGALRFKLPIPTRSQMLKELKLHKLDARWQTVTRCFEELGIDPPKDERGGARVKTK